MKSRWKPRFTYANVMSSIAVFVALGGSAFAASHLVTTNDIANQAVTTQKLRNGAVTPHKLQNQAVRPIKLARNAVYPAHLRNFAVRPMKLAPGAVFTGHLRDGAVIEEKVSPEAITGEKISSGAVGTEKLSDGIAGVALAGVQVAGDHVTVVSSFNRFGGNPTVQTDGAGAAISFPGLTLNPNDFVHQATLMGNQHGEIRVRNANIAGAIRVLTGNSNGTNDRRPFSYTVYGTP